MRAAGSIAATVRRMTDNMFPSGSDAALTAFVIVASLTLPLIIFANGGNVVFAIASIIVMMSAFVTFYRLEWGFFILVVMVFVADGYDIAGLRPWTYTIFYLLTFNVIFKGLGIGVLTPMESHLIFIIFVWVVNLVVRKDMRVRPVPMRGLALLTFGWLAFSVVYGKMRGGDPMMALWEVRALSYLAILYFLVPQIVTKKEHITTIFWILIWTVTFKAYQAIDRFVRLGFDFGGKRTLSNHEDPLFIITLFLLLMSLIAYKGDARQRRTLYILLLPLLLGFYLANRRATYAALAVCIAVFVLMLTAAKRRKIVKYLVAFGFVFVIYLAAYWNSYGRIAMVASAVRSTYYSAIGRTDLISYDDYSSGLARDQENYNLAVTFRKAPVAGIGFGNQHEWVIMNYGEFALKGYITHNEILWLITKTGIVGYLLFFTFINAVVLRGTMVVMKLKDEYLRAAATVCVLVVFGQIVVSYVDMQLTFFRNMVHLGLLVGIIPCIESIDRQLSRGEVPS